MNERHTVDIYSQDNECFNFYTLLGNLFNIIKYFYSNENIKLE